MKSRAEFVFVIWLTNSLLFVAALARVNCYTPPPTNHWPTRPTDTPNLNQIHHQQQQQPELLASADNANKLQRAATGAATGLSPAPDNNNHNNRNRNNDLDVIDGPSEWADARDGHRGDGDDNVISPRAKAETRSLATNDKSGRRSLVAGEAMKNDGAAGDVWPSAADEWSQRTRTRIWANSVDSNDAPHDNGARSQLESNHRHRRHRYHRRLDHNHHKRHQWRHNHLPARAVAGQVPLADSQNGLGRQFHGRSAAPEEPTISEQVGGQEAADDNNDTPNDPIHQPDWCQADCAIWKHGSGRVCASDGHTHESPCDLHRSACRQHLNITQTSMFFCTMVKVRRLQLNRHSAGLPQDELLLPPAAKESACDRAEYDTMKLKLLDEFKGSIELLFKHLDSNQDDLIDARELWPKLSSSNDQSQLDDDGFEPCSHQAKEFEGQLEAAALVYANSKPCRGVEFAFEPHRPASNTCSLSHLMIFDPVRADFKHDRATFVQLFTNKIDTTEPDQRQDVDLVRNDVGADAIQSNGSESIHLTHQMIELGETRTLDCLGDESVGRTGGVNCKWTRNGVDLSTFTKDSHILVQRTTEKSPSGAQQSSDLKLRINKAQLYLSGKFECSCQLDNGGKDYSHTHQLQVIAKPRVSVRPKFQWSLPNSRVLFECQHDYIDTSSSSSVENSLARANTRRDSISSDALQLLPMDIRWAKEDPHSQIVDAKNYRPSSSSRTPEATPAFSSPFWSPFLSVHKSMKPTDELNDLRQHQISATSARASLSMGSTRLALEGIQLNDTGSYVCQVNAPIGTNSNQIQSSPLSASDRGQLLVRERFGSTYEPSEDDQIIDHYNRYVAPRSKLWIFHAKGISVYKISSDDGQELELWRTIDGHSAISAEVDGVWNQLTLCGGLNQMQMVICEWSDNALDIRVRPQSTRNNSTSQRFIYVGQPNLNRVIVIDEQEVEIVAIINSEPQPRKLVAFRPNKIHLSRWVRRRLSPLANARWLQAIGTEAHPLERTPADSWTNSMRRPTRESDANVKSHSKRSADRSGRPPVVPSLVQHDIWLLCYGQPAVVDPTQDESDSEPELSGNSAGELDDNSDAGPEKETNPFASIRHISWPYDWPSISDDRPQARLSNQRSIQVIQSTFLPRVAWRPNERSHHHSSDADEDTDQQQNVTHQPAMSTVARFKKSTVLTTHFLYPGPALTSAPDRDRARHNLYNQIAHFGLIRDLYVPQTPDSLENNPNHELHYAYVTHFNDRRLYRVSMDEYRYDNAIDLKDCDPLHLISASQGLLIVQCRSAKSRKLAGQLVLDELTSSRLEFNSNIIAQESHLSPDHRYLVSIYNKNLAKNHHKTTNEQPQEPNIGDAQNNEQSIVYVQLVSAGRLRFRYEIKTLLEINQCLFVWKEGYYAAVFISSNKKDKQTELLSLRLADGRLELIARVPGLTSSSHHKSSLDVSPKLKLATLNTDQGTYVIDLEENRIAQTLRNQHPSASTLLWVLQNDEQN